MPQNGTSEKDPVVELMEKAGVPVNLTNYFGLAYPEGKPKDWGPEDEAQLPPELRKDGSTESKSD